MNRIIKNIFYLFCFLLLPVALFAQNEATRPGIGLALSGGGAKGLAHIGLLMAIDSAGINIDYVTGTSMGAIVGGLYAAGYTGKEIEEMARDIDWGRILSNKPRYDQLLLPYKNRSKQFVEVPFIDKKIYLGKGVLESNELWLWLSDKFSAWNRNADFADLPIPFRCVATRLDNGETIVLSKGNLVEAIRASMSIPAVFTPVVIDSMALIDGGLVRNFPVSDVRQMGAGFVIGSSVADPQLSLNAMKSPIEILSQIAFFAERRDFKRQVRATNILVEYPIEGYNTASFSSASQILEIGIKRGREMIPALKKFKDSLDRIYGVAPHREYSSPNTKRIRVKKISATGLKNGEWEFYKNQMNLKDNQEYSISQLSNKIRSTFGSGDFNKITYSFGENEDGASDLNLHFQKDFKTHLLSGLSYDETGLGIKIGARWNETPGLFSTSMVAVSIGESPQFLARSVNFLGHARKVFIETRMSGKLGKLNYFNQDLATIGAFRQNHLSAEANLAKLVKGNLQISIGGRWEYLIYRPEIESIDRPRSRVNFLTTYFQLKFNNQDAAYNPRRGNKIMLEGGKIFSQHAKFTYRENGNPKPQELDILSKNPFTLDYYSSHALPIKKSTLFAKFNAGFRFNDQLPYLYNYAVGGSNFITPNQILFPGSRVNGISSASAASGQFGVTQNFSSRFSTSVGFNVLWYDLVKSNVKVPDQTGHFVDGVNLTIGYETLIGPLEISLLYNSRSQKVIAAFSLGYSLNFSK